MNKLLVIIALLFIAAYGQGQDITTGLQAHWKFDDTGSTAYDAAGSFDGNINIGSVNTGIAGMVDDAFTFFAEYGVVNVDNTYNLNYNSFTLSAWINPSSFTGSNVIVSKTSPDRDFVLKLNNNKIEAHFYNGSYKNCMGTSTIPTDKWTHVLCTWSNNQWKIYCNGVYDNSASYPGESPPWLGNVFHIGALEGMENFYGTIDDVRMYNRALTATDVQYLYNSTNRNISVNDISVDENEGTAIFTISLDRTSSNNISGSYNTINGTAVAGTDYTAKSGTFQITSGASGTTVSVPITDNLTEGPESKSFDLQISGNLPATIADGTGTCTILDDDVPMPSISVNDVTVNESAGNAVFTIEISQAGSGVSGEFNTGSGSATSGSDYTATSGIFSISGTNTTTTVSVPIISDALIESTPEYFYLSISNVANAVVADAQGKCTINDDTRSISVEDITDPVLESAGNALFTITLSGPATSDVTGKYYTVDGNALAGTDYVGIPSTNKQLFTIPANSQSTTVSIPIINDNITEELYEIFNLSIDELSNNVAISDLVGQCTIKDDDTEGLLCQNTIVNFPYEESFENALGLWQQATDDSFDWENKSGDADLAATGPNAAQDGSYYMFIDAEDPINFSTAGLLSPCFDLTSETTNADFSFYFHMWGVDIGTLELFATTDGAEYTCLKTIGNIQGDGSQGEDWIKTTVSLNNYLGQIVKLKFLATTTDGPYGDIAIDNLKLLTGVNDVVSVNGCTGDVDLDINFSSGTDDRFYLNSSCSTQQSVLLPYGRSDIESLVLNNGLLTSGETGNIVMSANYSEPIWNAGKLNGIPISEAAPGSGQVLKYDGSVWEPADDNVGTFTSYWQTNGSVSSYTSGFVGIGTSVPDQKLTVAGNIQAEEVEVLATIPPPDYVFNDDYELLSISGLERYLKKYSHLPGVPPASEMEAKGISLSEMSMVLLKRIEEMTLHIIAQEKRIVILENSNK